MGQGLGGFREGWNGAGWGTCSLGPGQACVFFLQFTPQASSGSTGEPRLPWMDSHPSHVCKRCFLWFCLLRLLFSVQFSSIMLSSFGLHWFLLLPSARYFWAHAKSYDSPDAWRFSVWCFPSHLSEGLSLSRCVLMVPKVPEESAWTWHMRPSAFLLLAPAASALCCMVMPRGGTWVEHLTPTMFDVSFWAFCILDVCCSPLIDPSCVQPCAACAPLRLNPANHTLHADVCNVTHPCDLWPACW